MILGEQKLHEMPSTLGVDSPMPCLPSLEVSPLHVIFDLNGVLVTTCFDRGRYQKAPFHTSFLDLD